MIFIHNLWKYKFLPANPKTLDEVKSATPNFPWKHPWRVFSGKAISKSAAYPAFINPEVS